MHGVLGQHGQLGQHVRHDEQVEDEEHGQVVHDRYGQLEPEFHGDQVEY